MGGHLISLDGKTAVITGASSGLGRELALLLGPQGMNLALASRREAPLEVLACEVRKRGSEALVIPTDVTDPVQCGVLIGRTVERFGGIDYLILGAGVSMWARFDQIRDVSIFRRLMEVNFLGIVHCLHPALEHLKTSRGTVVAISSTQAVLGVPNHSGYTASKHALRGFLETLNLELEGQVRILQVMPGWVRGTNLRVSAFSAEGTPMGDSSREHHRDAVSLSDCARRIVQELEGRKKDLYIPVQLAFVPWLKLLAPGWLRKKVKRAITTQE